MAGGPFRSTPAGVAVSRTGFVLDVRRVLVIGCVVLALAAVSLMPMSFHRVAVPSETAGISGELVLNELGGARSHLLIRSRIFEKTSGTTCAKALPRSFTTVSLWSPRASLVPRQDAREPASIRGCLRRR